MLKCLGPLRQNALLQEDVAFATGFYDLYEGVNTLHFPKSRPSVFGFDRLFLFIHALLHKAEDKEKFADDCNANMRKLDGRLTLAFNLACPGIPRIQSFLRSFPPRVDSVVESEETDSMARVRDRMRKFIFGTSSIVGSAQGTRNTRKEESIDSMLMLILLGTKSEMKGFRLFFNTRHDERQIVKKLPRACDNCSRYTTNLHISPCCLGFTYCHQIDCILSCRRFWDMTEVSYAEIDAFQRQISGTCISTRKKILNVVGKIDCTKSSPSTQKIYRLLLEYSKNPQKYMHKACEYITSTKKERQALLGIFESS